MMGLNFQRCYNYFLFKSYFVVAIFVLPFVVVAPAPPELTGVGGASVDLLGPLPPGWLGSL